MEDTRTGGRLGGTAVVFRQQHGFSLIEVLLCVVLLAILIPALLSGFAAAYAAVQEARMIDLAKAFAQFKMEELLATPMPESMDFQPLSDLYPELFPDGSMTFLLGAEVVAGTGGVTVMTVTVKFPYVGKYKEFRMVAHRAGY